MENKDEEIKDEIVGYKEIDAITNTKGGKRLLKSIKEDVLSTAESLTREYKTATHMELIALCAGLESKLGLYKVLTKAKDNIDVLETILEEEEA